MRGYIGVTSRDWFTYLEKNHNIDVINFWRKKTSNFKSLTKGDPFFFLVKNEKGVQKERAVLGKADFERFEVLTPSEAWDDYNVGNGDENKSNFINRMNEMFETNMNDEHIGCIILSNFQIFTNPVYLSEVGIDFKKEIVSGKRITASEVNKIIEYGFGSKDFFKYKFNELDKLGLTDDDDGFPEGQVQLKKHLVRERNNKVIKQAKKQFAEQNGGKLFCEICGFDFKEYYGEVGDGYIEGHHTKPVSEMSEDEETKVEDIALVCANCHRMLHRKRPWLTLNQIKNLLK